MDTTTVTPEESLKVEPKSNESARDTKLEERKATRFSRFKTFAKTKRGKIILSSCLIFGFGLITAVGLLTALRSTEPDIIVADNIASNKIYENYDFIYNSEDNKLIASTTDKLRELEIISGEEKIMDYIISPDKKKIAYSLSDKNYKNKITSTNADITKFRFEPVAFTVYELNLETGENKLIWSTDRYELGATQQDLYKDKMIVYPDSYSITWNNYDSNGNYLSYPVSYSTPISYVEYVDDIDGGYNSSYLPTDLYYELGTLEIKLISYNSESSEILLASDKDLLVYNTISSTTTNLLLPDDNVDKNCYAESGQWKELEIVYINFSCYHAFKNQLYIIQDERLIELEPNTQYTGILSPLIFDADYTVVLQQKIYTNYSEFKPNLNIFNYDTRELKRIQDLEENQYSLIVEVVGSDDNVILLSKPIVEDQSNWGERNYTLHKYIEENNSLEGIAEIRLPNDLSNFIYNARNNTLSYYRRYSASTETIIEYKTIDLNTKEEKEILSIKVDNDSVVNYKPKLIWLDLE